MKFIITALVVVAFIALFVEAEDIKTQGPNKNSEGPDVILNAAGAPRQPRKKGMGQGLLHDELLNGKAGFKAEGPKKGCVPKPPNAPGASSTTPSP